MDDAPVRLATVARYVRGMAGVFRSVDGHWEVRQERDRLVIYRRVGETVGRMGSARSLPDLEAKLRLLAGIELADLIES